jgi:limonene-1,2-epoxide hydrolase
MQPKAVVKAWVDAFNRADVEALTALYSDDAINHQVAESAVEGREAIGKMFTVGFATTKMICIVENIFQDGEWAILEWCDPQGLRGCGFFHVVGGKNALQRGYWDKLSFLRLHGLPHASVFKLRHYLRLGLLAVDVGGLEASVSIVIRSFH